MQKQAFGPKVASPLSSGIQIGNLVFLSGQVPITTVEPTPPDYIESQTRLVLDLIRDLLTEVGGDLSNVVKTTVFLTDIRDFKAMNSVYEAYFRDPLPARSTVEVRLAVDVKIEIEAIAVL